MRKTDNVSLGLSVQCISLECYSVDMPTSVACVAWCMLHTVLPWHAVQSYTYDQSCAGEREFVKDNKSLGNFRLDGIPPAPRGVPPVEVKFDIDANGILSVTATDKGTQKKQDIKITGASTLNSDEVDRMVQEAEKYSEEDKQKRDAVETKNQVCLLPDATVLSAWLLSGAGSIHGHPVLYTEHPVLFVGIAF